jgi:hypothetical protein
MLARKKSYVELENFSFTFNDAEDYATSEKWQKIIIYFQILEHNVSVLVELW